MTTKPKRSAPAPKAAGQDTLRCFGTGDPLYEHYHDIEWGHPVHGEAELLERLVLEGFQVGLSWILILRRREAFREAFHGFDPARLAELTEADIDRLAQDRAIVRNRQKITAAVTNARAVLSLWEAGRTLDQLIWSHCPAEHRRPRTFRDLKSQSPESTALARDLKAAGFRFIGPVTAYATMQACGLVNDHLVGCPAGDALAA
ncbi:MAG: DNA-3-methyladenine glycosylase I [Bifidobacteriaceae bacterium]|nr:DNA-3-methyladenine glycosylase I [Bifidobacteriaceae bacterium]